MSKVICYKYVTKRKIKLQSILFTRFCSATVKGIYFRVFPFPFQYASRSVGLPLEFDHRITLLFLDVCVHAPMAAHNATGSASVHMLHSERIFGESVRCASPQSSCAVLHQMRVVVVRKALCTSSTVVHARPHTRTNSHMASIECPAIILYRTRKNWTKLKRVSRFRSRCFCPPLNPIPFRCSCPNWRTSLNWVT